MEITKKKLEELKPYPNNAKAHPESQIEKIARSIKEFGFRVPILISEENEIIAGHGRVEACNKLGIEEVPTIVADNMTDEEIKAFRIADNRLTESGWDYDLLKEEIENLKNLDFDISFTGFSEDELESILMEDNETEEDFDNTELNLDSFEEFNHKCPKCGYEWD